MKFIRTADVVQMTGLSRSTIWRMEKVGLFPRRNRVIGNSAVRWVESDVIAWMESKVEETKRRCEQQLENPAQPKNAEQPENPEQPKKQLHPTIETRSDSLTRLKFKFPKRRT